MRFEHSNSNPVGDAGTEITSVAKPLRDAT